MNGFERAMARLLVNEGGYVNDPNDRGGETKFGISKRAYPEVNIAALTAADATAIYRRDYWAPVRADEYDGAIGFHVFDMAVNSGCKAAVKNLQRAVGAREDGAIGPATLAAVNALPACVVVDRFNAERLEFMTALDGWNHFGRGWVKRIAANLRSA